MTPHIRIAVVPFTLDDRSLLVGLMSGSSAAFPGGPARPDEPLDSSAKHLVRVAGGRDAEYTEQLYTLNHPDREHWEIVVSYIALFRSNAPSTAHDPHLDWRDVRHELALAEVDRLILQYALIRLRAKLSYTDIAFNLMPETFTLSELQTAYETILERALDKRNFRRRMIASRILEQTNELRREGNHRPAALYRFAPDREEPAYLTPPWVNA